MKLQIGFIFCQQKHPSSLKQKAPLDKGPSINDVSSEGEGGGVKNRRLYLAKSRLREREGGHKIGKMGRRRLWMVPCLKVSLK